MWELIKANQRKSMVLFAILALCLMMLGYLVGAAFFPPDGGITGLFLAIAIWTIMSMVSLTSGDKILLAVSGAKEATHDVHPQLFNIVEEMKIAANFPAMPKVYIMNESAPNAFATGYSPNNCAIAVTSGLLAKLDRDELQGVVAHEMAHIVNRDVQFLTMSGILLGTIVLTSEIFLRGMWYSSASRRYSSRSSSGGGQAQMVIMLFAILFAILAPILAQILYFAISRKREYLADASGARFTRYPEGLASALEKISGSTEELKSANKITAPMYISIPFKKKGLASAGLTSTHPPIENRIKILRSMMGGGSYRDYQNAFSSVVGGPERIVPASGLENEEVVPLRKPSAEPTKKKTKKEQLRQIGDITRAANGFMFAACVCGLKVKAPPNFKKSHISCPRCGRDIGIPVMAMGQMKEVADSILAAEKGKEVLGKKQTYVRKTSSWESVRCNKCGNLMQISPMFAGTHMKCHKCKSAIEIESASPSK